MHILQLVGTHLPNVSVHVRPAAQHCVIHYCIHTLYDCRPVTPTPKGKLREIIASLKRASQQKIITPEEEGEEEGPRVMLPEDRDVEPLDMDTTSRTNMNLRKKVRARRKVASQTLCGCVLAYIYISLSSLYALLCWCLQ